MKTIKLAVLIFSLIFFSSRLNAQSSEVKPVFSGKTASALDELKINVTDSTLSASFRDSTLPVSNIMQLDKYLKNNPGSALDMKALITTKGQVDPERYRSLLVVLGKNKIQSVRSFSEF